MGGEEIVIGTAPANGATQVTASSYLFDQQIARFLSTLPPPPQVAPGVAAAPASNSTVMAT